MTASTVQYYNGKFALPYNVRIELHNNAIHIFDAAYNIDNGMSFPLSKCKAVIQYDKAFVYLNDSMTDYIVLPSSNEFYASIITGINQAEKGWYNKLLSQKWYTLFALVIVLLGLVYLILNEAIPAIALKFISVNQEKILGEEFYKSFISESEIDSTSTFIIQKFSDKLKLSRQYPIKITVAKDKVVNAFALPGGHLVVYSGIIKQMEKPEELVALLSHESSHVNKRHSLKSILSRLTMSLTISLITSDINGLSRSLISNAYMLKALSYSRTLEKEADNEGMQLMVNNNINPVGMKWLMQDLRKMNKEVPADISFLSTHPLTDKRIENADQFSKKYIQLNEPLDDELKSLWLELKKHAN
jgi:Zn-dependent protease with chaperone function